MKKFPLIICIIISVVFSANSQNLMRPVYNAPKALVSPEIDGVAEDECWNSAAWDTLHHEWYLESYLRGKRDLPPEISNDDLSVRFKLTWDENFLYMLAEIRDDIIHDDVIDPLVDYWNDDCLEVFIDEDHSGGDHKTNFNAFAYHISAVYKDAVDIGVDGAKHLFNDNLEIEIKSQGDLYTWEIAFRIFDEDFSRSGNPKPLELFEGKTIGFSAAYCEDDGFGRENFLGWVEGGLDSWKDAGLFGTVYLTANSLINSISVSENDGGGYESLFTSNYHYNDQTSRDFEVHTLDNENQQLIKKISEEFDTSKGKFVPVNIQENEYDDTNTLLYSENFSYQDGKLLETEYLFFNNGITTDNSLKEIYLYDENGMLITKTISEYMDDSWVDQTRMEFSHNLRGQTIAHNYSSYIGNEWEIVRIDSFQYSDIRKLSRRTSFLKDSGKMKLISEENFGYTNSLMPEYSIYHSKERDVKTLYNYDTNHFRSRRTYTISDAGQWVPVRKDSLDSSSVLWSEIWDGGDWQPYKKRVLERVGGNLINEKEYIYDRGNYNLIRLDTTHYSSGLKEDNISEIYYLPEQSLGMGIKTSYDYYMLRTFIECIAEINGPPEIKDEPLLLTALEGPGYSYEWIYQGTVIGNESTLSVSDTGVYTLKISRDSECEDIDQKIILASTSSEIQNSQRTSIRAYPNPVKDIVNISIPSQVRSHKIRLRVFSYNGQIIFSRNIENVNKMVSVDLGSYESGTYVIELISRNYTKRIKLIKY